MESTFASRVLEFRRLKGLSQKAFAERCDLEQGNITQMEKGTEPKRDNVAKLVTGFPDLNPDWLLLGNGSMLRDGKSLAAVGPTPGITSGPATVAEAENVVLRERLADQKEQISDMRSTINFLKEELGKFGGSLEAALLTILPNAPKGAQVAMQM